MMKIQRLARVIPGRVNTPLACAVVGLWLLLGFLINDYDQSAFNLQQMGVEALVERHQFSVEGSVAPELQPRGDLFRYGDRLLPAKQPGQFFMGAVAYAILHAFGLSYVKNYLLTASLVTWLTSSLITALAGGTLFRFARALLPDTGVVWPAGIAGTFVMGTIVLPYSGVTYHDTIATGFLAFALFSARPFLMTGLPSAPFRAAAVTGLWLGLTITTSMLPAPMVVVLAVAVVVFARGDRRTVVGLVAGTIAGLLPLLIYDLICFGNPFLVPNVAGDYHDTFFSLRWDNFVSKVWFYTWMITFHVPVAWLGVAGLLALPRSLRRLQIVSLGMIGALLGYVLNIDTVGFCQYGPRYLLPAMPLLAVGSIGIAHYPKRRWRRVLRSLLVPAVLLSTVINVTGALYGAMYCDPERYAFTHYLKAISLGIWRDYPLSGMLVIPVGVWVVWCIWLSFARTGSHASQN